MPPDDPAVREVLSGIRRAAPGVFVAGSQAEIEDIHDVLGQGLPQVGLLTAGLIFGVLFVAFRSAVLRLKAILVNLLPVVGALGVVTLVFQHG